MTATPRWPVLALLAAAAAAPVDAAGQVSSSAVLRGEVTDSAGAPVIAATVAVLDGDGGRVAAAETDEAGRYALVGLPPGGPYTLVVERVGFAAVRRNGLRLVAGGSRRLDITLLSRPLELPGLRAVAAPGLVFSGTRTGATTVIDERTIAAAPMIDRDVTALAALSPLAAVEEQAISVAGQNTRFNSLRVDGALAQDVFGLSPNGVPGGQANAKPLPIDAVRQYSVLVAPFDVRLSGFTGGVLDATTRSGGDRWSASAFASYRDAFLGRSAEDAERIDMGGAGAAEDFSTAIAGVTIGGPLLGARVFVAGELERRRRPLPGFHLGRADPIGLGLVADSVASLVRTLADGYGFEAGETGAYPLENPLGNLFARLDVPIGPAHDLSVRYNRIRADEDVPVSHLSFGPYELGSAGSRLESGTHAAMARLASRLGERTMNELMVSVQRTSDAHRPASAMPQVEVEIDGRIGSDLLSRRVQAGGDPLAHASALDQTTIQVADNVSHAGGDHLLSAGLDGTWFGIRRLHLPASRGIWRFDSLPDLVSNRPSSYERLLTDPGSDPAVELSLLQLAAYAQDEWAVGDRLSLTLGLRLDLPIPLDRPPRNPAAALETGVATDALPGGEPLLSPRIGFNWSPPLARRTQLRGGVGVFTGLPPLAWIADAYANTGLRTSFLRCTGAAAPGFDPADPPTLCADGSGAAERDLVFFGSDFRYPRDVRASLAVDHELPWSLVATIEAVYTRSLDQVSLEDLNLGPARTDVAPGEGYPGDIGTRPVYGVPRLVPDRFGPLDPDRRWDGYGRVIRIGNRSRNAALAVAAELQRRFSDRFDLRLAYAYTRAVDTRSLLYLDAGLNYGLSPTRGDPGRPETRPAAFDRPHRVVASAWTRLAGWGDGLDASVVYVGQSGLPYSYVYESDVNGDGYPGPGAVGEAYNDLFRVPVGLSDIDASIVSGSMLLQLVDLEPCLERAVGGITARNACRAPWSNRLDLRLSQGLETAIGRVALVADLVNALNLIDPDWGLVRVVPPVVPILRVARRSGCPGALTCAISNRLVGEYTGPRRRSPRTGSAVAALPYLVSLPDSRWRAQIGVRIEH